MDEERKRTQEEAAADQAFAYIADTVPLTLARFRKNLLAEGFSVGEAWLLTVEYFRSLLAGRAPPKE